MRPWHGVAIAVLAWLAAGQPAQAGMTEAEMCETIRSDIATYRAMHRLCPCPYSTLPRGQACGDRSAWAKPDGLAPRCYFSDVTGERAPNKRPSPVRQSSPPPPPCTPTS